MIAWEFDLQLPVQSVPITIKVASSNPAHGELYSIQRYVIKFSATCDRSVVFSPVSSTNNTNLKAIADILLKTAVDTIILALFNVHISHCSNIAIEEQLTIVCSILH